MVDLTIGTCNTIVLLILKDNPVLNSNNEIWKSVSHVHEVSNLGRIRNLNGNVLKPWISTTGYYNVKFIIEGTRKNIKLHRLICEAFIPNPDNKPDVNHIDGNKLNNNAWNLEWCTHLENMQHASSNGLINRKPRTTGIKLGKGSKYHNVCWDRERSKWSGAVRINNKSYGARRFTSEIDAALHVNYLLDLYDLVDRPRNIIT